jgi:hypothetical protein
MKPNEMMRKEILQVVENQISNNTPPETKQTFNRLVKEGISKADAKIMIGQCVAIEIFNVMKHKQPFDKVRFVNNLNKLPGEVFDDE